MPSRLGFSRYLTGEQEKLPVGNGALVFVSAHIPEEAGSIERFEDMVRDLKQAGYRVVCDIDSGTPGQFGVGDERAFLEKYDLDLLRLDDGYCQEDLLRLVRELPVALNASTIPEAEKRELLAVDPDLLFMHNFYPKEDTGLDPETFAAFSAGVPQENLAAFIPGDRDLRGPLREGLPTLEADRNVPPYVAYARLNGLGVGQVFVGDPGLSRVQRDLIGQAEQGIWPIPCYLSDVTLYEKPFTIRQDSPKGLRRLQESRAYGKPGETIRAEHAGRERRPGDICQDNWLFGRYSGEVTLVNEVLPGRDRINNIGRIHPEYVELLDLVKNGEKIMLIPECMLEEGELQDELVQEKEKSGS